MNNLKPKEPANLLGLNIKKNDPGILTTIANVSRIGHWNEGTFRHIF